MQRGKARYEDTDEVGKRHKRWKMNQIMDYDRVNILRDAKRDLGKIEIIVDKCEEDKSVVVSNYIDDDYDRTGYEGYCGYMGLGHHNNQSVRRHFPPNNRRLHEAQNAAWHDTVEKFRQNPKHKHSNSYRMGAVWDTKESKWIYVEKEDDDTNNAADSDVGPYYH